MKRVEYIKLTTEPLQCGDMWASVNPNTPERQGESEYNLQMKAVHPTSYGKRPSDNDPAVNIGNGGYWRPVGIVILHLAERHDEPWHIRL
jgi:hypothetical protein